MDGLEEEATSPPHAMIRLPPIDDMMRSIETGNGEPPAFGSTYALDRVEDGIAFYRRRA